MQLQCPQRILVLYVCYSFSGKLLPLAVYNELDLIMTRMYTMFLHDQGRGSILTHQSILSEYVFIDGENLTCIECGVSYQQETRRKLDLFTVSRHHFFTLKIYKHLLVLLRLSSCSCLLYLPCVLDDTVNLR